MSDDLHSNMLSNADYSDAPTYQASDAAAQAGIDASNGQPLAGLAKCQDLDQSAHWDANDPDVWRVLEFDLLKKITFYEDVAQWSVVGQLCMAYIVPIVMAPCAVPLARLNARDRAISEHAALTAEGLRYKTDRRRRLCRLDMCMQGATSKTVPYDRLQDVEIDEPAGNTCCCVQNTLYVAKIQTAAQGGVTPEIVLHGLKYPHEFRRAMLALNRQSRTGGGGGGASELAAKTQAMVGAAQGANPNAARQMLLSSAPQQQAMVSEMMPLMKEQTTALREQVCLLRDIQTELASLREQGLTIQGLSAGSDSGEVVLKLSGGGSSCSSSSSSSSSSSTSSSEGSSSK